MTEAALAPAVLRALEPEGYAATLAGGGDPWAAIQELSAAGQPLAAWLTGPGLLRPAAVSDDVAELLLQVVQASGIGLVQLDDPLNDLRNLEAAARAARDRGLALEVVVHFAPAYTQAEWTELGQRARALGPATVAIALGDAEAPPDGAVEALRSGAGVPVRLVLRAGGWERVLATLRRQLQEGDGLGRLADAVAEARQVLTDLGEPPLSAPVADLVAQQAAENVLAGERYRQPSRELMEYLQGLRGWPPRPADGGLTREVLGHAEPIEVRPAELLEPQLPAAEAELRRRGDEPTPERVLAFVLYPQFGGRAPATAGSESAEPAESPQPDPDSEAGGEPAAASGPVDQGGPARGAGGEFDVEVEGEVYRVRVAPTGQPLVTSGPAPAVPAAPAAPQGTAVVAPMQGLLVKVSVKAGDQVQIGDVVAVLEAMKMQNDIVASTAGTVGAVVAKEGEVVSPNQPLLYLQ